MKTFTHILTFSLVIFLTSGSSSGQGIQPVDITIHRDDITLQGKFYQADGPGTFPTILLLPGFPGGNNDVIGLGARLARSGINMMMINYSGTHESGGLWSYQNVMADITAAREFLFDPLNIEKFKIDTGNIVLGGHSYGGGMAMTYAIKHPEVHRVISIAGNDWGDHFEDYVHNPDMKAAIDGMVDNAVSKGIVRPAPGEMPKEFLAGGTGKLDPDLYLERNAGILARKDILLICGWNDRGVSIEDYVLPLYRALQDQDARHVRIVALQDGHNFLHTRDKLAGVIKMWLDQKP